MRWFRRTSQTFTSTREMSEAEAAEMSRRMDTAFARMDEAFREMDAAFAVLRDSDCPRMAETPQAARGEAGPARAAEGGIAQAAQVEQP